jgi:hypothetical protein
MTAAQQILIALFEWWLDLFEMFVNATVLR